jgi:hypothetical protein
MVGRDGPRVWTRARIYDLLSDMVPVMETDDLTVNDEFTDPGGETYNGVVDSLKDAGYSDGDIVPAVTFSSITVKQISVTSTSFQSGYNLIRGPIDFSKIGPTDNLYVSLGVTFEPGSGETITGRVYNFTSNEEIISTSGAGPTQTDWVQYNAPSNGAKNIAYEHKTEPGSNSSNSQEARLFIGVQI